MVKNLLFLLFFCGNLADVLAEEPKLALLATGDTMLGSWVEDVLADTTYSYPFDSLRAFVDEADIFFTNLEAPFGITGVPFEKKFNFRVKPHFVNVLVAGNVNLVSLANNHMMDYGESCLYETLEVLTKHNIRFAGAGRKLDEARRPAIFNIEGKTVGFVSYSLTFPEEFWATDTSAGTCFPKAEFVYDDVAELKDSVDIVIASCHWGQELREDPKPYQISLAHQLIDHGADIVLGHHPHIVQGIEFYKGKLIAYSLGNFIFGSYSERVRDSMMLRIELEGDELVKTQIVPIDVYNRDVEFQPRPLTGERRSDFLANLVEISRELNADSIGISDEGVVSLVHVAPEDSVGIPNTY